MKKTIIIFGIILAALNAHAIAIIPPALYVASLSIIAFISNILITTAVFAAAKGAFGTGKVGKNFSSKLNLILEIIGNAVLIVISITIAVFAINPITLEDSILAGIIAALITLGILLLNAYKRLSIVKKNEKKSILTGLFAVFAFVIIAGSIAAYSSVELKAVSSNYGQNKQTPILEDISNSISNSISAPSQSMAKQDSLNEANKGLAGGTSAVEEKDLPAEPSELIFIPTNSGECRIESETHSISITPKTNCVIVQNGLRTKTFCPIIILADDFYPDKNITSSGSCSDEYNLS